MSPQTPMTKWVRRGIVALVVGCLAVPAIYWVEKGRLRWSQSKIRYGPMTEHAWIPFEIPGVNAPKTISAADASRLMPDDEQVFGIVVAGKARAYRTLPMRDRLAHIVNDVVANQAVSVTFCDISDCVQVYHDANRSSPLPVSIAGLYDGEMVIRAGNNDYIHKSGLPLHPLETPQSLSYDHITPERTTWKEWRLRHPETDVFVGVPTNYPPGFVESHAKRGD